MSGWPFHRAEREAQARAGAGASGGGIRDFLTDQHRAFFPMLPFVAVAAFDGDWPSATLLDGEPGFVAAPDPYTLRISAALDADDPAHRPLAAGRPAGILGIDFATRRRNRANGVIDSSGPDGLVLDVRQSFGNCPQYIQVREIRRAAGSGAPVVERLRRLGAAEREAISRANVFFVASAAHVEEAEGGVDISHRGGAPGFVRVQGDVLTVPDFKGNRYFNTLGNLLANPRAALLFVDFERGDLLHLRGTTEIVWEGPDVSALVGAERLWRFRVEDGFWKRGGTLRTHRADPSRIKNP
jgi:predicted pyridoxine 5'-phosphate oxidase superfamily flavin-nucleotide-binding protein